MLNLPISLIIIHFIADFILQNDWMALNKSKNWGALSAHVGVYSGCFFLYSWYDGWIGYAVAFGLITFITHFITDAITSRITSRLWFFKTYGDTEIWRYEGGNRHYFFVMIGLDQLIHYGCLAWTLKFLS